MSFRKFLGGLIAFVASAALVTTMSLPANAVTPDSIAEAGEKVQLADVLDPAVFKGVETTDAAKVLEDNGFQAVSENSVTGSKVYSKDISEGLEIRVDSPPVNLATAALVRIKWDPLPYLVGTGEEWASMLSDGPAAAAAIVCSRFGAWAGAGCGVAVKMVLSGAIDVTKMPNRDKCYWMKNLNLPPEEVSRSECN